MGAELRSWHGTGPGLYAQPYSRAALCFIFGACVVAAAVLGAFVPRHGTFILAAIPAAAFATLCFVRPDIGVLFVAATIPVEGAAMLAGSVTAPRIIGLIVAGAWITHKVLGKGDLRRVLTNPLVLLGIVFLAYAAVSTIWAPFFRGTAVRLATLAQLVALGIIAFDLTSSWERLDRLAKALLLGGLLACCLILVEYLSGAVRRAGDDVTAGDMNAAARLLVTLLPIAFYLLVAQQPTVWRIAGGVYVVLATVGVALTFSRASLLLLPFVLLVLCFLAFRHKVRPAWLALPVLLLVAAVRFIPADKLGERMATVGPYLAATFASDGSADSRSSRGYHMQIGLAIFRDHPILGAGYHSYGDYFLRYQMTVPGADKFYLSRRSSHGSHWGLLADLGLVGIALWIALLVWLPASLVRCYRQLPRDSARSRRLLVIGIALAFALHIPYGMTGEVHKFKLFWLLFGMGIAARALSRAPRRHPRSHSRRREAPFPASRAVA